MHVWYLGVVGDEECGEGMEQEDEEEMEDGEPDHIEAPLPEEELNNQVCFCMTGGYGEWSVGECVYYHIRHLLYYVCTYIRTYSACMNIPVLLEAEVTDGQSMESSSMYGTEAASSDDHLPSNSTQPDMQVCVYIFLCST